ncbi:hypothetical protein [Planococcus sp. YIM B11945]|uniref:hypothetical protein n=1 Tax=Planococcus sp. YIM B11945 TaxID=3435410 RepID=UPI003D7CC448
MKVRIGAIGPPDSLRNIREVASLDRRIELVEFEYFGSEQLPEIMEKHRYEVKQWIFSGQAPYYYCLDNGLITEKEASYPPLHGMALLGTCLQVMQENGRFVSRMSLDTVDESTVKSLFTEYRLDKISFELLSYEGYKEYEEIIDFHVQNYNSGKVEVALTCLLKVYLALQKRGIPCYRVVPSKMAINTVLALLVSRAQSHVYEKQKVAIIGFQMFEEGKAAKKSAYSFVEKQKELELEQELLQITKKLNGSLINKGSGAHFIYTTQGDYELLVSEQPFYKIANEIKMRTSLNLHIGVGSGYTIYDAEQHVQMAFEHAAEKNSNEIIYVNEEGIYNNLNEGQQQENAPSLQLPSYWTAVLKEFNYREHIPMKVYQYVKLKNITFFTSDIMTVLLKNTDRNSRRILSELEKMNLIRAVPEENNSGKRGRPKKIYELVMEEK